MKDSGPDAMPVVCAVIRSDDGKCVLACRRNMLKSQGGLWEFPGGKVQHGETLQDALLREIREELGVMLSIGSFLTTSLYTYDHGTIALTAFNCSIIGGEITPSEHEETGWIDSAKAAVLDWAPADVPIVKLLFPTPGC